MSDEPIMNSVETNTTENKPEKKEPKTINFQIVLDQIVLNLKVMGDIKNSDKLSTVSDNIEIDPYSYARCIYRTYYGDNRIKTIEKLQEVVEDTNRITDNLLNIVSFDSSIIALPENNSKILQDLIPDMVNANKGLQNLKLTYKDDVLTENKLDMVIKKLNDQIDKIKNMMTVEISKYYSINE